MIHEFRLVKFASAHPYSLKGPRAMALFRDLRVSEGNEIALCDMVILTEHLKYVFLVEVQ